MALTYTGIHDLAETLLGCVCVALDQTADRIDGQPGCPCYACVVPGPPAWDHCDGEGAGNESPGQLTVHVGRIYPTTATDFSAEIRQVQGVKKCSTLMTAAELYVTLLRCAPGPDQNGNPPPCEEQAAAARTLHTDMATVWNALLCCLPETGTRRRGPQYVVGPQRVLGPQGYCVGLEQKVTLMLPSCLCPEDESP